MSNIENLKAFGPFADAAKGDAESVQDGLVHVRIQQRNGRKTFSLVGVILIATTLPSPRQCYKLYMSFCYFHAQACLGK